MQDKPNPSGLCMCGCGEPAPLARRTQRGRGYIAGQPVRFIPGHNARLQEFPRRALRWVEQDRGYDTPCWIWQLARDRHGYGRDRYPDGRTGGAHRVLYLQMVGPIPDGLELDHLCRVPACVNPAHLEPVTHQENVMRGLSGPKTHCLRGHEYSEINTYFRANGRKVCRVCKREMRAAGKWKSQ